MRIRIAAGLLGLVCWLVPPATADNYPRQPGIDVQHYVFRVSLTDRNDEIAGETTAVIRFVKDGVTQVALDLATPANGKGMTVTDARSDSVALKYEHRSSRLTMALATAPKAGETLRFTVKYHGVPAEGLKFVRNKFGDRCMFSQNWPDLARQWLPTIDHPYDKATSEFLITAPSRYQVVANGLLVEAIDLGGGRRTTHWKQSVPIATWLNNIGVAEFAYRNFGAAARVPLETWVFPKDRERGIGTLETPMRQAMEFYSDRVGPYPYEKLAGVENGAADGGGMEHASAIFYGQNSVDGRPAMDLVAHEIAHQWFGDSVTENDWDDVWLSEGFATYFAMLTAEHYEGRDAFVAALERSRADVFTTEKRLPGVAVIEHKPWRGIPNGIVYRKGAWTLHMLRGEVGSGRFWAGIREYYRRYRDGNASTADFRKVMEDVSGADLGWFFEQWLDRAGSPAVAGGWRYNSQSARIEIDLEQTEQGAAYRLPLEFGIVEPDAAQPRIVKIVMTGKLQKFEIACGREPRSVTLDPNTWMLIDASFTRR